jgi:hypothetical protein
VAKKRAIGRYPKPFRNMAVERLKGFDNIVAAYSSTQISRRALVVPTPPRGVSAARVGRRSRRALPSPRGGMETGAAVPPTGISRRTLV